MKLVKFSKNENLKFDTSDKTSSSTLFWEVTKKASTLFSVAQQNRRLFIFNYTTAYNAAEFDFPSIPRRERAIRG